LNFQPCLFHFCKLADFHVKDTNRFLESVCVADRAVADSHILFFVAARFDVCRVGKKKNWSVAKFVDLDFVISHTKRLKFHFPRTDIEHDIWVEAESDKIAPLDIHTNNTLPRQRKNVAKVEVRLNSSKQSKLESFSNDASSDSSWTRPSGGEVTPFCVQKKQGQDLFGGEETLKTDASLGTA
jgi:hypothetical protein